MLLVITFIFTYAIPLASRPRHPVYVAVPRRVAVFTYELLGSIHITKGPSDPGGT